MRCRLLLAWTVSRISCGAAIGAYHSATLRRGGGDEPAGAARLKQFRGKRVAGAGGQLCKALGDYPGKLRLLEL